jgi:hypothetical protein
MGKRQLKLKHVFLACEDFAVIRRETWEGRDGSRTRMT